MVRRPHIRCRLEPTRTKAWAEPELELLKLLDWSTPPVTNGSVVNQSSSMLGEGRGQRSSCLCSEQTCMRRLPLLIRPAGRESRPPMCCSVSTWALKSKTTTKTFIEHTLRSTWDNFRSTELQSLDANTDWMNRQRRFGRLRLTPTEPSNRTEQK